MDFREPLLLGLKLVQQMNDWDHSDLVLEDDALFEVKPVRVVDRSEKTLRGKNIPLVRILWSQHGNQEKTKELETEMRSKYPELFMSMD